MISVTFVSMQILNPKYWDSRYKNEETGWDIGYANPAIVSYFESVADTNASILIPGCGNAYEGEALHKMGFENLTLLDYASQSKQNFLSRVPSFDPNRFVVGDFFEHQGQYDYVVEQTFFCALDPTLRLQYTEHMSNLLKPEGTLVGLLFNIPLFDDHPPFGGKEEEYRSLFAERFKIAQMTKASQSIPARRENELFIELIRK